MHIYREMRRSRQVTVSGMGAFRELLVDFLIILLLADYMKQLQRFVIGDSDRRGSDFAVKRAL
jgi:hypothetical protein